MSSDELREFLEREILSKYTFLFSQKAEDASPEHGVHLQDFMNKSLGEMQLAIESHIHSAIGSSNSETV